MYIPFSEHNYSFEFWTPTIRSRLAETVAFAVFTAAEDEYRPWICPPYVLGVAYDGQCGVFVTRDYLERFLAAHADRAFICHDAPLALEAVAAAADSPLYDLVEECRIWDTRLMHRLLTLAQAGHTAGGRGESTLETCARTYLGVSLADGLKNSIGRPVRLSYGQWLNRPAGEIESVYLHYAAESAMANFRIFGELRARSKVLLRNSAGTWGYVSDAWRRECGRRFGPLTHHVQLKGSIALRSITANGLRLDVARLGTLSDSLREQLAEERTALWRDYGFRKGNGSAKALQAILRQLARRHPQLNFPRDEKGQLATGREELEDLRRTVPFVELYLQNQETEHFYNGFVGKMAKAELHPQFDPLAVTGRTSSFGEINAQNLPKKGGVRECIVPHPGFVFIDADFKTIELAALAQAVMSQFGLESEMANAINAGEDLHTLVAARMFGKEQEDVTEDERQKAKAINFGKPGGMGDESLAASAKTDSGDVMTPEEASAFSEDWFDMFPEMRDFLADALSVPAELARLLDLTPATYAAHTGVDKFHWLSAAGQGDQPLETLGMMLLTAVKEVEPKTKNGRAYTPEEVDFFFSRLESATGTMPYQLCRDVANRVPSKRLQAAVMGLVGKASVFTLTGRLRAAASSTARHNTIFQGLAADGAKLALWKLLRAGYRVVNFIHDQVLVEVPADSDLKGHAERIRELMIAGMTEVITDVKVDVTYAASDRWHKDAKAVFNEAGDQLLLWYPPEEHPSVAG